MPGTFDTRVYPLVDEIDDQWDPEVRGLHWANRRNVIENLAHQYGEADIGRKLAEFAVLGPEPFSVVAYHTHFFRQVRNAFVIRSYYPALTGACALGERILNHLIRALRDDFKSTAEYKTVYDKVSFDNWAVAIDVLDSWGVLLPDIAASFRKLAQERNKALHFRPETDDNARELALGAIRILASIIEKQFGSLSAGPWYMDDTPGESYLKHDAEALPFVKRVIIPSASALHVGPLHEIAMSDSTGLWVVTEVGDGGPVEGSDAAFLVLLREHRSGGTAVAE